MSNPTVTLIPTTTFGSSFGNYDANLTAFSSNISQGDGYYGLADGLHTVSYSVTNFLGNIQVQGTLTKTPTEIDWFAIDNTLYVGNAIPELTTTSYNFIGNFVWIRANVVAFSQGTINKVLYNRG
jgi:hypothetical protein